MRAPAERQVLTAQLTPLPGMAAHVDVDVVADTPKATAPSVEASGDQTQAVLVSDEPRSNLPVPQSPGQGLLPNDRGVVEQKNASSNAS